MPEETHEAALLEQTKNQIRKLVAEIADLAESDIQPAEFTVEFLNRAVAAVAASGGAFWMLDGRGSLKLQHQLEFRLTGLMDGRAKTAPHDALLGCMLQASQPQIIPPGATIEGFPNAGNPTPFALIVAPLVVDKQVAGLIEILMDPNRRAATQKSTLRFVGDLCDLAASFLKNRQMRQMMSQQRLWNQLEGFTHQIHGSLDLKETSYSVANDGKRLVGCDRLSVAIKIGGRVMVEAISGQEIVEQRSNLVRELTRLCKAVVRSGDDLVYTGNTEGFAPDIRDALELYVDESGSKTVIITLLYKPDLEQQGTPAKDRDRAPFGCLVAEQIGDELTSTDTHAKTEVVSRHASTALWNSSEHDKIFLLPLLKLMGSPWRFFRGRTLAKILAVVGAILALILILTFVPWKLTIEGRGSILPEQRQNTYAPVAGIVVDVPVEHGQLVKKGDLIARLDSRELEKERRRLLAEMSQAQSQVGYLTAQVHNANQSGHADEVNQLKGQLAEAREKATGARQQIEIIAEEIDSMSIAAPVTGIVTTWEVKKNLMGRPVEIGQELIAIAGTEGEWVLVVDVSDDDMGPVLRAQSQLEKDIKAGKKKAGSTLSAYFVTATDPQHRYIGNVKRIASNAETVEAKHVVKVTVGFTDQVRKDYLRRNQVTELRPGAEVRARIQCGEARLAYVLLRDVIHVFYESVLFRWPFLQ
jgi:multidrug efflux pump subunit AcrA (membrane-fusion protein)